MPVEKRKINEMPPEELCGFVLHELASPATALSAGIELLQPEDVSKEEDLWLAVQRSSASLSLIVSYMRAAFVGGSTTSFGAMKALVCDYFKTCCNVSVDFSDAFSATQPSFFACRSFFLFLLWGHKFFSSSQIVVDCKSENTLSIFFESTASGRYTHPKAKWLSDYLALLCQKDAIGVSQVPDSKNAFILKFAPSSLCPSALKSGL